MTNSPHRYFANLDLLRFYLAISVVVAHTASMSSEFSGVALPVSSLEPLFLIGHDAVTVFFVLSGFLIDFLLLVEREQTGDVNVRRFWMRRVLRIWPLYYLVIALALVLTPEFIWHGVDTLLAVVMLSNVTVAAGGGAGLALIHLWSISTEEQFYLLWPGVFRRLRKWLPHFLIGFIFVKLAITLALPRESFWYQFLFWSRFEAMAMGGLMAYLYFRRHRLLNVLYSWPVLAFVTLVMLYAIIFEAPYTLAWDYFFAFCASIFVLNIATRDGLPKFAGRRARYLGALSFGIYMYHPLAIWVASHFFNSVNLPLYAVAIILTVEVAARSYQFVESPFLRLKNRYAPQFTRSH